jgi:hypothetical protein
LFSKSQADHSAVNGFPASIHRHPNLNRSSGEQSTPSVPPWALALSEAI